jgi:hypothetical protein
MTTPFLVVPVAILLLSLLLAPVPWVVRESARSGENVPARSGVIAPNSIGNFYPALSGHPGQRPNADADFVRYFSALVTMRCRAPPARPNSATEFAR